MYCNVILTAYQLISVNMSSLTKSENLATATDTCTPRLPVLIYSKPFLLLQNYEMQVF